MIKHLIKGILILCIVVFNSCIKAPNHSIRVNNSYNEDIYGLNVGTASYGTLPHLTTSGYKPVNEGSFNLSGSTLSGKALTGGGSVKGNGTHKWTITINSAGGVSILEDK